MHPQEVSCTIQEHEPWSSVCSKVCMQAKAQLSHTRLVSQRDVAVEIVPKGA